MVAPQSPRSSFERAAKVHLGFFELPLLSQEDVDAIHDGVDRRPIAGGLVDRSVLALGGHAVRARLERRLAASTRTRGVRDRLSGRLDPSVLFLRLRLLRILLVGEGLHQQRF